MPSPEIMEINMGPQHPATHGVMRLKLWLNGERIVKCEPVIGYLHRGTEKLCENRDYRQITYFTDRTDYIVAAAGNLAHVMAVEKLADIEIPKRAQYMRVIFAELGRIANHLVWLATHAFDIGAMTILMYAFREREDILDIYQDYCGARLTLNIMKIGGFYNDITPELSGKIQKFIKGFPKFIAEYETILSKNRIWLGRTVGIGILPKDDAINLGVSGPPLRGSGVAWDIRKDQPYCSYEDFDFNVAVEYKCDTYDRYLVRMEEMKQSCRIIQQAIDGLPESEIINADYKKATKPVKPPAGEVYFRTESPKGELAIYIKSDGSTKPYRWKMRSPCFANLMALPKMVEGHLIADVIAVIGTLDPVFGEVDR